MELEFLVDETPITSEFHVSILEELEKAFQDRIVLPDYIFFVGDIRLIISDVQVYLDKVLILFESL